MTIKKQILEILIKKESTALEISAELTELAISVPKKRLWSYLSILLNKDKKIEIVNDKKPYIYRATIPMRYLKDLYNFMSDENKCIIQNFQEKDLELVQTIKELIK